MSNRLPIAVISTVLFASSPTLAADAVQVLGYNVDKLQLYDETGKPLAIVDAKALPAPPFTSPAAGPAKSVGIPYQGKVVFVRRLDLKVSATPCLQVAQAATHGAGSHQAGQRMGAGGSDNCLVQ